MGRGKSIKFEEYVEPSAVHVDEIDRQRRNNQHGRITSGLAAPSPHVGQKKEGRKMEWITFADPLIGVVFITSDWRAFRIKHNARKISYESEEHLLDT